MNPADTNSHTAIGRYLAYSSESNGANSMIITIAIATLITTIADSLRLFMALPLVLWSRTLKQA